MMTLAGYYAELESHPNQITIITPLCTILLFNTIKYFTISNSGLVNAAFQQPVALFIYMYVFITAQMKVKFHVPFVVFSCQRKNCKYMQLRVAKIQLNMRKQRLTCMSLKQNVLYD